MEEIICNLKGISCMLEAFSTDGYECRWEPEGIGLLNDKLIECIEFLEKQYEKK